jgi:hypothetical protein
MNFIIFYYLFINKINWNRIICKILLDFVHRLNYETTAFRKLDSASVFRYKRGKKTESPSVGTPGWASLKPEAQQIGSPLFYLKTEAESSLRNAVVYRRRTKSKRTIFIIITHHCQKPSDFDWKWIVDLKIYILCHLWVFCMMRLLSKNCVKFDLSFIQQRGYFGSIGTKMKFLANPE